VAAELGLALVPTGMSYGVREPRGGTPTTVAEVRAAALAVVRLLAAEPSLGGSLSAADLLRRARDAGAPRGAVEALQSRAEMTNGASAELLAAGVLGDLDDGTQPWESRRVVGGNQQIAVQMAAALGPRVLLRHAVDALSQADGAQVRVGGRDAAGARFSIEAAACVLAVPMPHAERLLRTLPGSVAALDLVGRLGHGEAAKLHVPLRAGVAASAVLDAPGRWWSWTAQDARPDGAVAVPPVVSCFGGSRPALDRLGVDDGPAGWAARLAEVRPELDLDLDRAIVTNWREDPWALGSYSFAPVGAWPHGEPGVPSAAERLIGRVVLAGEWTAGPWYGLLEGALRSGERAAADLLAASE
jgi:monoamine oxidase